MGIEKLVDRTTRSPNFRKCTCLNALAPVRNNKIQAGISHFAVDSINVYREAQSKVERILEGNKKNRARDRGSK